MAESLYPPYSRLYVACDKNTTEEELTGTFQNFGSVQNVNLCRDRATGKPKGFAFVQFDKTSEAATAMEAVNGSTIGHSNRPVRVTVALSRDQASSSSSNDPSQFHRLFLVIPKTFTENDLDEHFSRFGSIENVSIVKDRETKENKGYAYVKYKKFSDAARAFENCDRSYKVVFAKPKGPAGGGRPIEREALSRPEPVSICTHIEENPHGYTGLWAQVSMDLPDEHIEWLFDIPPGLEYVRFFNEIPYDNPYSRKVFAQYDSPGTAAYALRKLDGFEYPAGSRVRVKPDYQYSDRMLALDRQRQGPHSISNLMQQVESLNKSLNEATRLIKSAGISTPFTTNPNHLEAFRCSAKLPPPQPLAPSGSVPQERLFVVCEPGLPPQDALWDVFSRFGNLIELYILNGKNCGYAKYSDKDSAHKAMQTLNGQELYRMKLKVLIAEPQREDRKRPRTNYD
ncbi:RNA-binding protein 45-like isoform X2 [Homalodisca vitripennis]|uniref:RNA-binding protein 45-like isoform X2 n=1 Tax=Homalodisca vitripennis TaxID=197043 RepID=UPI001EEABADE|nr:RNA-binding protein 45-like isoform X2 [Homalodisca vitripennis]